MPRFSIQQFKLNNTLYPGASGYQLDRGVEVRSEGSDGTIYETTHQILRRKPAAEISTLSMKTLISALTGGLEFPYLALDATNGLIMYGARQAANAPGYNSSSVHESRTALRGVVWMSGVRWSLGSPAEMMLSGMFTSSDGTTEAVTESHVVALPTLPTPDFGFILSALTVGGSAITAVNSVELSIDPRFDFDHSAGLPEPTSINGAGSNGRLAITAKIDVGDIDLGAGTGACSIAFKALANGGGLGTDTVTFTLNSAWSQEENFGGRNSQPMGKPLMVRTRHNGSTRPLTWAVA